MQPMNAMLTKHVRWLICDRVSMTYEEKHIYVTPLTAVMLLHDNSRLADTQEVKQAVNKRHANTNFQSCNQICLLEFT